MSLLTLHFTVCAMIAGNVSPVNTAIAPDNPPLVARDEPTEPRVLPPSASVPLSTANKGTEPPRPTGRGWKIAGYTLLGIGWTARAALDGYWIGVAKLDPREPFGHWGIPQIWLSATMTQLFVVPGLLSVLHGQSITPDSGCADRPIMRWKKPLFWTGVAVLGISRAFAPWVLRRCETNGCAFGYFESSYWVSAALIGTSLAIPRAQRAPSRVQGLSLWRPTIDPRDTLSWGIAWRGQF